VQFGALTNSITQWLDHLSDLYDAYDLFPGMRRVDDVAAPIVTVCTYEMLILRLERVYERYYKHVADELISNGINDLTAAQALILYDIKGKETCCSNVRYSGSNASYNLTKLEEHRYIVRTRSRRDKRQILIRMTTQGQRVHDLIAAMHRQDASRLHCDFSGALDTLKHLEHVWASPPFPTTS
jgi:DNA-binding MarR family transcriptional regulator